MIRLHQASLQRGQKLLFENTDLTIYPGQRCGISGANGTGKSSLFQLILGKLQVDKGDLHLPPQAVIAHVAQETPSLPQQALEYVIDGDGALRKIENEMLRLQAIENPSMEEATALAEAIASYEEAGGYTAPARAAKLLDGLGFSEAQMSEPVSAFSGGWRMRLNLAQALMCQSDILLLDEPTNHLDIEAVLWLEQWLSRYPNTLLLISHDRDFLNSVCNHIIHLHQQQLNIYKGDFDDFERMRAERMAHQEAAYEKQQKEIDHLESFVRRFKAKASKAKQAQSRVKTLEKMVMVAPLKSESPFTFSFLEPERAGDPLLRLDDAAVGYHDEPVLSGINLNFRAGDRIGLLGQNGAGKSTLVKLLAGDLQAMQGESHETDKLKIGYFAQHQLDALDNDATPLIIIQRLDKKVPEQQIKNFLGGFNFKGDRVHDNVKIFSGGERARLALAALVWQRPNLILMDEPTNHLDLQMRDALTQGLQAFTGAMVVISHDRYLLRACCDQFLRVHRGTVSEFEGDLDDYRQAVNKERQAQAKQARQDKVDAKESDKQASQAQAESTTHEKKAKRQLSAEVRQQLKPMRVELRQVEQEMEKLSKKSKSCADKLTDASLYEADQSEKLQRLLAEQGEVKKHLDAVETRWMELSEQLEAATEAALAE